MSDLVGNPVDRFSCVAAQMILKVINKTLPFVNLYISFTVSVAKDFNGSPLRPPISDLRKLCNDGGRLTVVLLTINPSTLPWEKLEIIFNYNFNTLYLG